MPQVGAIEIACGIFLLIGPKITKLISLLILSSVCVGAMYFRYILKDPTEELVILGVILFLLFIRLNLHASSTLSKTTSKEGGKESKKDK